jgi:GTP pyrophosphokinase
LKSVAAEQAVNPLVEVTSNDFPEQADALLRARNFAQPLIAHETLDTGENTLAHADAVAAILKGIGGSDAMQAACYLVYACDHLNKPEEAISKGFGESYARLALETTKLVRVQRQARAADRSAQLAGGAPSQTENVRKMLLAFSRDLRVVMLRLASRLQTLRHYAATKQAVSKSLAHESLHVFAPLANRLGIWQIKWEMEDLSFRFLEPDTYKAVAKLLDEKRVEREDYVEQLRLQLQADLKAQGVHAQVQGRPKHIYSIVRKMRGKSLDFDQVLDVRALRIITSKKDDCYAALAHVHAHFSPISNEFDDYIAKPKSNGYQSLHTVVRNALGQAIEIQIRTQAMHDHAETGVAAHWAYKEAGAKGYAGVSASSQYDAKIAVLRQLLAWERDLSAPPAQGATHGTDLLADRIYVLTPEAAIVDLPVGATPVDFAYIVHTNLGHRCRGAKVDGALVPLNTPLQNGQTVEVTVAKEGGPSRDWLNPDLGYIVSPRSKAKVRAWFNALALHETVARGREAVEKLLQREGKTSLKLDDLAAQLGFKAADDLFEVVGKDEFSLRTIEQLFRPAEHAADVDEQLLLKKSRQAEKAMGSQSGVLVVGVDSLLTQLAKCCKPAPPDAIGGFVTRGKGVSIHRADCSNFKQLLARDAQRVIDVAWGKSKLGDTAQYAVDVAIEAQDRPGLLRDITEVLSKEKIHVTAVQSQITKGVAWMTFTVQISATHKLQKALGLVCEVNGVRNARRR